MWRRHGTAAIYRVADATLVGRGSVSGDAPSSAQAYVLERFPEREQVDMWLSVQTSVAFGEAIERGFEARGISLHLH